MFIHNRLYIYYNYIIRNILLSKLIHNNIHKIPKIINLTIMIKRKKLFKNFFLYSIYILLFLTKYYSKTLKKNQINKKKYNKNINENILGNKVILNNKNFYYFLDNFITTTLPLNLELFTLNIKYNKNTLEIYLKNFFHFLELEDFFENQIERFLIEKNLILIIQINFNNNNNLLNNQHLINLLRLPINLY